MHRCAHTSTGTHTRTCAHTRCRAWNSSAQVHMMGFHIWKQRTSGQEQPHGPRWSSMKTGDTERVGGTTRRNPRPRQAWSLFKEASDHFETLQLPAAPSRHRHRACLMRVSYGAKRAPPQSLCFPAKTPPQDGRGGLSGATAALGLCPGNCPGNQQARPSVMK